MKEHMGIWTREVQPKVQGRKLKKYKKSKRPPLGVYVVKNIARAVATPFGILILIIIAMSVTGE